MCARFHVLLGVLIVVCFGLTPLSGQNAATAPRTPWGEPDLPRTLEKLDKGSGGIAISNA